MAMSDGDWKEKAFRLGGAFRPTTPINRQDLFKGRKQQVHAVVDAINQPGQHAVLYGERGVGKTSLANMIFPNLYSEGLPCIMPLVNCMSSDTFSDIWRRVFEEINFKRQVEDLAVQESAIELLESYTAQLSDPVSPDHVRRLLHVLGQERCVVVILDEFDTVVDRDTRRTMADTIKFLSDRNVPATVVLIGVADDVEQLIENHRSVERCLSQIPMPRMSRDELEGIVVTGLGTVEMSIRKGALHEISRLSRGLPHYAHLLGLFAGRAAVEAKFRDVDETHVKSAVSQAIDQAQASIKNDYVEATTSARKDASYREVLLACALAESDELGFFYPADARPPLERIKGKQCAIATFAKHLHAFCENTKGRVLTKDEKTGRARYRFTNPLLQPFVLIRGLADGILTEEDLKATRNKKDPQGRLF